MIPELLLANEVWIPFDSIKGSSQVTGVLAFFEENCKLFTTQFLDDANIGPIGFEGRVLSLDDRVLDNLQKSKRYVKIVIKEIEVSWVYFSANSKVYCSISNIVMQDAEGRKVKLTSEGAIYPNSLCLIIGE